MTAYRRRDLLASESGDSSNSTSLVLIDGKVYDVHDFIAVHPGGNVIKTHLNGEDATNVFAAFHPASAYETLADYYVGDLVEDEDDRDKDGVKIIGEDEADRAFTRDVDALRNDLEREGMFQSNKLYYIFKVCFNYGILGTSMWLLHAYGDRSWTALLTSAFLLGLFWQQSGYAGVRATVRGYVTVTVITPCHCWLAHDFLHHQVFRNRAWNNAMGYLLGNLGQGFSVGWWKDKHNSHHAAPNVHGHDPDIDTMPLLAWAEFDVDTLVDAPNTSWAKQMVSHQPYTYFLLLTFARLAWAKQSWDHAFFKTKGAGLTVRIVESMTVSLHWAWVLGSAIAALSSWQKIVAHVLVSQGACGLMLALVFSLNHNGMHIFGEEEARSVGFYRKQVVTGRDVDHTVFMNWFTGGLNFQIEHHLFPSMPRHNFAKIEPRVKALCKKHNVPYHCTGFLAGTKEILVRLSELAAMVQRVKVE